MKYRERIVEVEAIQWTGRNQTEILDWLEENHVFRTINVPLQNGKPVGIMNLDNVALLAEPFDFIVKNENGDVVPYSPEEFHKKYEEA